MMMNSIDSLRIAVLLLRAIATASRDNIPFSWVKVSRRRAATHDNGYR